MVVNDANIERIMLRRNVRKINILCANVVCVVGYSHNLQTEAQ